MDRSLSSNIGLAHLNWVPVNSLLKYYDSKLITVADLHSFFCFTVSRKLIFPLFFLNKTFCTQIFIVDMSCHNQYSFMPGPVLLIDSFIIALRLSGTDWINDCVIHWCQFCCFLTSEFLIPFFFFESLYAVCPSSNNRIRSPVITIQVHFQKSSCKAIKLYSKLSIS